jgi:hypothetical protein
MSIVSIWGTRSDITITHTQSRFREHLLEDVSEATAEKHTFVRREWFLYYDPKTCERVAAW